MLPINHSFMPGMPELAFGSVWLVSAGDGDPGHLLPLAEHAISTADAVIHDPEIPGEILDLVKPPRYREAAVKERAIERSIKLAQDGWRVAYILRGDAVVRAIECASNFADHSIPFRVAPVGEPLTAEGPIGLFLVHKPLFVGRTDTDALVVLIAAARSTMATKAEQRQPPLGFSMSGLAG